MVFIYTYIYIYIYIYNFIYKGTIEVLLLIFLCDTDSSTVGHALPTILLLTISDTQNNADAGTVKVSKSSLSQTRIRLAIRKGCFW